MFEEKTMSNLLSERISVILKKLSDYDLYEFIYPDVISSNTGIPLSMVFMALFNLVDSGQLQIVLNVDCPRCKDGMEHYHYMDDIPVTLECDICDMTVYPHDEIDMIFKVIKEI